MAINVPAIPDPRSIVSPAAELSSDGPVEPSVAGPGATRRIKAPTVRVDRIV
jgi:hypothetical protein